MNVVFVEPSFPNTQRQFVRALAEVGATVIGIGETPKEHLDGDLRGYLTHYEHVGSVVDEGAMVHAVRMVQAMTWVDRLESTIEAHVMSAARVREACGIPGTSVTTAFLCRDKPAMKEALRRAGVATAQSTGASTADEIREFAAAVGLPIIIKPPDAAGAAGTFKVDDAAQLESVIAGLGNVGSVAVEEFVEGHEGFYDTLTIDGTVVHEFISHYYPNVLEAMRTRWISPQIVATNRVDSVEGYSEIKEMGRQAIAALGIGTSATHMEWFASPKGLRFSEIACRPPGVGAWDLYSVGNDLDLYREWASAVVHGAPTRPPSRRLATGMVALRPDRDGHIARYEGLDEIQGRYSGLIIDAHLPEPGTPTQGVEAGYMANAWVRMRHNDYDELRGMLDDVGRTVKVRAG
ncbi:MAG TPA: ATP-grasp domain-containing protein [Acidimicrobiales bacterium]|nr:ATP-grasp domain-containing protein [Acidimicrobiales bacterium]